MTGLTRGGIRFTMVMLLAAVSAAGFNGGCRRYSQEEKDMTPSRQTDAKYAVYAKMDSSEALRFIFAPRRTPRTPAPEGSRNIDFEVEPGIVLGSRFWIADESAPIILFFHGNGEIVADYDEIGPMYSRRQVNFWVVEFRGYGWSGGRPTVTNMMSDAAFVYHAVRQWCDEQGFSGPLFVMGRSLGSASAIEIAASYNDEIKGLIIESGFAETVPLARTLGFDVDGAGLDEDDGFGNLRKIERVTKPTFILHGQRDELIDLAHARKLHAACGARSKELQIIPGAGHNTMIAVGGMLYFETIGNFVKKVSGIDTWRDRRKRYKRR